MRKREREREKAREMQSVCRAGDARNSIMNRCFRTLILKLVNPLDSLEDRIAIHKLIDFYVHP